MLEDRSDLELVECVRNGDERAFELLVERYADKAYSLASRMTRNQEDAEEVLQDVFVALFRKIESFKGESSFSSWIYRITVNASLMKLRKRRQNRTIPIEDVMPQLESSFALASHESGNADNVAYRNELTAALGTSIKELPEDYRPVFLLRDVEGLTCPEVCEILQLSVPAVKSRLHRARLMLQRGLSDFRQGLAGNCGRGIRNAENC